MSADSSSHNTDRFPAAGPAVPWGPLAAVLLTVLAFFGSQALAAVLLVAILGNGDAAQAWLMSTAGQFYYVLLSDGFTLLAIWMFLRGRRGNFGQLGLNRKPIWRDLGFGLLGYAVYFMIFLVAVVLVGVLTQIDLNQQQELGFEQLGGANDRLMAFASLVLIAPIIEEIIFRGFVFTGMRTKFNFVGATILTSMLFAAPHLLQSSEGLLWIAGLDTLVLSTVLCYLREKTGSLWASMLVHGIKNGIAFLILLSTAAI